MRRINQIVWLGINLSFAAFMAGLLFSGRIYLYLSPRMIPMVWFGFAVFCILLIFNVLRLKSDREKYSNKHFNLKYLIFIVPVVLYLFSCPNDDSIGALPNQNLNLSQAQSLSSPQQAPSETMITLAPTIVPEATPVPANETETKIVPVDLSEKPACVIMPREESTVINTEFEYYIEKGLDEIYEQEISMYGFVYKDDSFPENTILVSRLLISCCVADASIAGFHVKVEDADEFENDEWIEVTGTVDKFPLNYYGNEYEFPIITGGTIIKCDSPDSMQWYIYP